MKIARPKQHPAPDAARQRRAQLEGPKGVVRAGAATDRVAYRLQSWTGEGRRETKRTPAQILEEDSRMFRTQKGFTLIELMIVVVIIGILAAIAIPNFIAMQNRAKEGSTKANMHTVQLAAEDYGVQNDGVYANTMSVGTAASDFSLPSSFKNPFSGSASAWENRGSYIGNPNATSGLTSYADSSLTQYKIKGVGKITSGAGFPLTLVLTSGQ